MTLIDKHFWMKKFPASGRKLAIPSILPPAFWRGYMFRSNRRL
jgi:hypothetical protein